MPQILQIRGIFVNFFLIQDEQDLVLIDGGFVEDLRRLEKALKSINKNFSDIKYILLTHGHIDHTLNIKKLKELTGAVVAGHPKDKLHIAGKYPYKSKARACGRMEAVGRTLLKYKPFELDMELADNQLLDFAGGIRVIHLPGHTIGHCGFYHEAAGVLFTGDLYQHTWYREGVAPSFLNSCPEYFPATLQKVIQLNPKGIYSNHSDNSPPELQWEQFKRFVKNRKAT